MRASREPLRGNAPEGVGGWLLLLCGLLLLWHPLNFGLAASHALASLPLRGLPLALVLVGRLLVTGLGIAAGLALLTGRPPADTPARPALAAAAAGDLFSDQKPHRPG